MLQTKAKKSFFRSRFFRFLVLTALVTVILLYLTGSVMIANFFTTSINRNLGSVTPASLGMPYEDVTFQSTASDHIKLRGWFVRGNTNRALIMLHAKDNTRAFAHNLNLGRSLWQQGYSLLMFDLRAHGQSEGDHTTYGQYEQFDVVGAVNFLKSKGYNGASIGVIGWSLGAASALMGMSQTPDIKAGIIDSSYADLDHIASLRLAQLGFFYPGVLVTSQVLWGMDINQARPEEAIKKLGNRHVLLIHGEADTTVPISEMFLLQKAGGLNVANTWVLPGINHAGAYPAQPEEYLRRTLAFFGRELA